jgi:glucosylceramidase
MEDHLNMFHYLNQTHHAYPGYFLLATEACNGYLPGDPGPKLGSWERGLLYSYDVINDLLNFASGWTDWSRFW